jgi:sugar-specific transcriptional regulator TrmB
MVAEYPEFKGIDINIYPAKKVEDLRARMLRDLAKKAEKKAPEAAAPVKKEEKPAAKKEAVKKEKKFPKQSGPGVIATIVSCIEGAGKKGISKDEILAELVKAFPDKDANSMKSTINVQVPARISKERFKVENKDGKYFKA